MVEINSKEQLIALFGVPQVDREYALCALLEHLQKSAEIGICRLGEEPKRNEHYDPEV